MRNIPAILFVSASTSPCRPGHELVADEKQAEHEMHEPLSKVINDAFKTMERQLKTLVERQRRE